MKIRRFLNNDALNMKFSDFCRKIDGKSMGQIKNILKGMKAKLLTDAIFEKYYDQNGQIIFDHMDGHYYVNGLAARSKSKSNGIINTYEIYIYLERVLKIKNPTQLSDLTLGEVIDMLQKKADNSKSGYMAIC